MAQLNRVVISGNLTDDPELREFENGNAVATFSLANNESFKSRDGEKTERTNFVQITTWGALARNCAEYLKKGSLAFVDGRLRFEKWETPEGEKRSALKVVASEVQFGPKRERQE